VTIGFVTCLRLNAHADELTFLLDQSKPFQEIQKHPLKKLAALRPQDGALGFFRELHANADQLWDGRFAACADTMNLQAETSSLKKGESCWIRSTRLTR